MENIQIKNAIINYLKKYCLHVRKERFISQYEMMFNVAYEGEGYQSLAQDYDAKIWSVSNTTIYYNIVKNRESVLLMKLLLSSKV